MATGSRSSSRFRFRDGGAPRAAPGIFVLQPPAIRCPVSGFRMSRLAPSSPEVSGAALTVGIAAARYNQRHVDALLRQVVAELRRAGVRENRITVVRVPGSHELPSAVQWLAARGPDVCVALGVIIRGGTLHYELVAQTAAQGLLRVALDAGIPVINGVIVAESRRQAAARCGGRIQRGTEFARAALEMGALKQRCSR